LILISTPKNEVTKEVFFSSLEKVCDAVPNYDMETVLRDFKDKVAEECSTLMAHPSQRNK